MCSNMFAGFLLPVKPQEVPKFKGELQTPAIAVSFRSTAFGCVLEEDVVIVNGKSGRINRK